jgi:hypothetical protein
MRGMIVRENPVSVRREMGPKVRKRMESATERLGQCVFAKACRGHINFGLDKVGPEWYALTGKTPACLAHPKG